MLNYRREKKFLLVEQSQTKYQKEEVFQLQRIAIIYYNERMRFELLHTYNTNQVDFD